MKKVLVVDDEQSVRDAVELFLRADHEVRTASDATSGIQALSEDPPDVLISDAHVPGGGGEPLIARALDLRPGPTVIVLSGQGGLEDFIGFLRLGVCDYVLKPFGQARLRIAVERAMEWVLRQRGVDQVARAESALSRPGPISRVFVRTRGRIVPVLLEEVEHLEAQGDYVGLWEGTRSYLIRVPIQHLLERLDPERFVRIHRSHVINLDRVTAFVPTRGGRFEIVLESGKTLVTSRARAPELRARLAAL